MMHETSVLGRENDQTEARLLGNAGKGRETGRRCSTARIETASFASDDQSFHRQINLIVDRFSAEDRQSDFDYIVGFSDETDGRTVMAVAVTATTPWRATRWNDCQRAVNDFLARLPLALGSNTRRSA